MKVILHGGPLHGQQYDVLKDANVIKINGYDKDSLRDFGNTDSLEPIKSKTGRYSQIRGKVQEFEWDGWQK